MGIEAGRTQHLIADGFPVGDGIDEQAAMRVSSHHDLPIARYQRFAMPARNGKPTLGIKTKRRSPLEHHSPRSCTKNTPCTTKTHHIPNRAPIVLHFIEKVKLFLAGIFMLFFTLK